MNDYRDLVVTLATVLGTSGAAWWIANANRRKIDADTRTQTATVSDERTRSALTDARDAERRAHRWADAFWRLWHWVQDHFADHHADDDVSLPERERFTGPDD